MVPVMQGPDNFVVFLIAVHTPPPYVLRPPWSTRSLVWWYKYLGFSPNRVGFLQGSTKGSPLRVLQYRGLDN